MGSKVVVTYKRKRLFSRSDHSHINLHSDRLCESAKSKTSNFHKEEGLITECTLQNNGVGFGRHVHSKDDTREDLRQCENHDSHCCDQCSEKDARKLETLHSVCAEQKDSSVSVESQKFAPEKKCSRESDAEQTTFHPDTLLNGSPEVRYKVESSSQSNAVKSSSEREDSCIEILTVSQPHAACSGAEPDHICLKASSAINGSSQTEGKDTSEASTFEETGKFNADQYSSLCNKSGVKRTLTSSLITFCRRSKRNRADNAVDSAKLSTSSCLVDLTNEKEIPTENYNLCGGNDNHHINETTQRLPHEDVKNRNMHNDVTQRVDSALSLDLSVSPHASHNIDCNLPLAAGSDENQPVEISEVLHDSLASTREMKEDMSSLPQQHIENDSPMRVSRDKGKCVSDSPPVLSCNSSKNNYIQFFPESRGEGMLQVANNSEKLSPPHQSRLQSSNLIGLSLRPEQIVQSRESFRDYHLSPPDRTQSYARDKMMLESILSRARAARGSRSSFLDKFEYPTTWLDEELDSLWIGVRRHGRGNWDAILGDRRLHFLPWKTPWDLSERWQVEQSRLLSSTPLPQRRYAGPPDSDDVRLSLGHSPQVEKRLPSRHVDEKTRRGVPEGSGFFIAEESSSSTGGGLMKGCLPQWLRAAARIPASVGPMWHNHPSQQPWLNNQFISTERRPEAENGRKGPSSGSLLVVEHGRTGLDEEPVSKQEDLIIIPSDASSEETISDDHSGRP